MKRLVLTLLALALVAIIAPTTALAYTQAAPYKTDLVTGPTLADIGDVKVWNDAANIYVKYETDPGWYLFSTSVEVKSNPGLILQADGNAAAEQFTYRAEQGIENSYTQRIPVTWPAGNTLYIAAHAQAGARGGSVAEVTASLPTTVTELVTYPTGLRMSYWDLNLSGGTSLDGFHTGWCGSPHLPLAGGWTGVADVISSYSPAAPTASLGKTGNLDSVNWVLNQDYVSTGTPWKVIQAAIWKLLWSNIWQGQMSAAELALVDQIVSDALSHDGFVPKPSQSVAIVLDPRNGTDGLLQPQLIVKQIPISGTGTETAWATGTGFPGSDWSMYFAYKRQVLPGVGTPIAPKTMRHKRHYSVYGSLKPRCAAGTYPVRIYKWKKTSAGKWKSYGYVKARARNYSTYTKYAASIKLATKGKWRLRAYAPASGERLAAWSPSYDYVTVK